MTTPVLWQTAEELCEAAPEEPLSMIEEIAVLGAITDLTAFIKAGKTTFLGAALRSVFSGEEFIGLKTTRMPVLYLTEEGTGTFAKMLMRSVLHDEKDLHVLNRGRVWGKKWRDVCSDVVLPKLLETGAKYIYVDTLSRWAGIKGEEENQTGPAQEAMEPLERLRDAGYGVGIVRHARKSGGDIGEAARGASAWGGAADVLLQLINPGTNGHPNRRQLESLGRFHDPNKWTIDLEMGHYRLVGQGDTYEKERVKNWIATNSGTYTTNELAALLTASYQTVQRALDALHPAGRMIVEGSGKKNDPKRYTFWV